MGERERERIIYLYSQETTNLHHKFIRYGSSDQDVPVLNELFNTNCLRHLFTSKAVYTSVAPSYIISTMSYNVFDFLKVLYLVKDYQSAHF